MFVMGNLVVIRRAFNATQSELGQVFRGSGNRRFELDGCHECGMLRKLILIISCVG